MEDIILFHKYYTLKTSATRLRSMVRWIQQSMAPWCLFDSSTRKVGYIDIVLGHSLLEATSKRLNKKEALLIC